MMARMDRRTMLVSSGAAALVVLAGGGYEALKWLPLPLPRSPEDEAADYAKLLSDVHDDYINGRVVEHQGWVLSQHEFDTLGVRESEAAARKSAKTAV
jgi:hypothetical protein